MATHQKSVVESGGPLGKTKKITRQGVSDTKNAIDRLRSGTGGVATIDAAKLFLNHPHFTIFPGDAVEIMEAPADSRPALKARRFGQGRRPRARSALRFERARLARAKAIRISRRKPALHQNAPNGTGEGQIIATTNRIAMAADRSTSRNALANSAITTSDTNSTRTPHTVRWRRSWPRAPRQHAQERRSLHCRNAAPCRPACSSR